MFVACLVSVAGIPFTAYGQDDFNRYFNAAVQLYNNGESELALKQLERAKQRTHELGQDIAVALYEGLSYADMSQWEKARDAFERALLLDPDAKFPTKVSPKVEHTFEEVRARVRIALAENPATSRSSAPKETSGSSPPALASAHTPAPSGGKPPSAKVEQPMEPVLKPTPSVTPPLDDSILNGREPKRIPMAPVILAGVGVAAAGVGTVFGLQSRSGVNDARRAQFQDETRSQLDQARSSARIANVLFGAAGIAVTGALVTWWTSRGDGAGDQGKGKP
jgi:tetratricopeptide (TPR) repeat protein